MTQDERFEEFLAREAGRYNAPPAPAPRDAMWDAIVAARAGGAPVGDAPATPPSIARSRPTRRPWHMAPWIGMAATLLLGVGLGRFAFRGAEPAPVTPPPNATVAGGAGSPGATEPPASTAPVMSDAGVTAEPGPTGIRVAAATRAGDRNASRTANRNSSGSANRFGLSRAGDADAPDASSVPYDVASRQHLTRAEALVAVVANMPADATMDSLTGRWARDVLANTRLLLDSPAGDDPHRRRLLEDLETVLVQLVQRSGRSAEDRQMIDRTLHRTQLLTRLRSDAAGT